jgi:2',3'-cyclic-nucleotide 2'-phosphodiesterase (5'-nucleotidase family)
VAEVTFVRWRDFPFVVFGCLLIGTLTGERASGQTGVQRIAILANAAGEGDLHPCRCPGLNSSSLALRASVLKRARTYTYPSVLVEGGDFAAPPDDSLRGERFDLFVKSMAFMGYDAVGLGDAEFDLGKESILKAAASLPLVCANLADTTWGIPGARRLDRGGFHILITGYVDPSLVMKDTGMLTDPVLGLMRFLPREASDSTIVILLAHGSEAQLENMLAEFPSVDVVVRGHVIEDGPAMKEIGKLPILVPERKGRNVVQLTADFTPDGALADRAMRTWELKQEQRGHAKIDALVHDFETRHGLE